MKQEITGYITGIINNRNRVVEDIKKSRNLSRRDLYIQLTEQISYTNELTDLLDFVQDIPEENHKPTNGVDVEKIKSYARKLERINIDLRLDNISWQKKCKELKLKKIGRGNNGRNMES